MRGLPPSAWQAFGIWLLIGLALYFLYGYRNSVLRTGKTLPPVPELEGPTV
ncbi:MAG: amino acid permease C-terminal domain-containing protein [Gemmatimonadaceae bacterium]|nr:amino acid permease C-terminal domain-containing protein [Gemmatimonadaceae bacterium]